MIGRPPRSPLFPSTPLFRSREIRLSVSTMWTGIRIVREWSAIARVMAWRIHHVAYVENLKPRRGGSARPSRERDPKSTPLYPTHDQISYAGLCFKKKK